MLIASVAVVVILLLEAIYCRLAKKRAALPGGEKPSAQPEKAGRGSLLTGLAGDFVFLTFKAVGYLPCHVIRNFLYRYVFCMNLAKKCVIYYGLEARSPWNITVGKGSIIGDRAVLDARYGIEIGENVNISSGVWIWTLQHDIHAADFGTDGKGKKVVIDDRAWVSSRVSVLPGCHIRQGCVIACGAVLTKDTPTAYGVYAGVPARYLCERNSKLDYEFTGEHRKFL